MKERPILFNTEMVRAILSGNKTQTRRTTKLGISQNYELETLAVLTKPEKSAGNTAAIFTDTATGRLVGVECPFGKIGDLLWVRETHAFVNEPAYRRSTGIYQQVNPSADYQACVYKENFDRARDFPWRPSIHMPRWASRITLEITGIRIEKLLDISLHDAHKEGIPPSTMNCPKHSFYGLWNGAYGEYAHSKNPWVWVIEFKQLKGQLGDIP